MRLQHSIAPRPYRCPGCRNQIEIGADHVLVRFLDRERHEHWHTTCVTEILARDLREPKTIEAEKGPSKGQRRAAAERRRRER